MYCKIKKETENLAKMFDFWGISILKILIIKLLLIDDNTT